MSPEIVVLACKKKKKKKKKKKEKKEKNKNKKMKMMMEKTQPITRTLLDSKTKRVNSRRRKKAPKDAAMAVGLRGGRTEP